MATSDPAPSTTSLTLDDPLKTPSNDDNDTLRIPLELLRYIGDISAAEDNLKTCLNLSLTCHMVKDEVYPWLELERLGLKDPCAIRRRAETLSNGRRKLVKIMRHCNLICSFGTYLPRWDDLVLSSEQSFTSLESITLTSITSDGFGYFAPTSSFPSVKNLTIVMNRESWLLYEKERENLMGYLAGSFPKMEKLVLEWKLGHELNPEEENDLPNWCLAAQQSMVRSMLAPVRYEVETMVNTSRLHHEAEKEKGPLRQSPMEESNMVFEFDVGGKVRKHTIRYNNHKAGQAIGAMFITSLCAIGLYRMDIRDLRKVTNQLYMPGRHITSAAAPVPMLEMILEMIIPRKNPKPRLADILRDINQLRGGTQSISQQMPQMKIATTLPQVEIAHEAYMCGPAERYILARRVSAKVKPKYATFRGEDIKESNMERYWEQEGVKWKVYEGWKNQSGEEEKREVGALGSGSGVKKGKAKPKVQRKK